MDRSERILTLIMRQASVVKNIDNVRRALAALPEGETLASVNRLIEITEQEMQSINAEINLLRES